MKYIKYSQFTMFLLIIMFSISTSNASSIDLNFHDNVARFNYATHTAKDLISDGGVLLLNRRNSSEQLFHLGVNKVSKNIRFGLRGIYTSPGDLDVLAISLGLAIKLNLAKKTSFDIAGYYAPELFSFIDAAGFTEFGLRLSYNITSPLDIYIGYRNIKIQIQESANKIELDDNLHVGLKIYF